MKKIVMMLLILATIMSAAGCTKEEFEGAIIDTENSFILECSVLNIAKSHELELIAGEDIKVVVEKKSGKLDLYIKDSNGNETFKGNDASSGTFSVNISRSGKYTVMVSGKDARGKVSFTRKENR